MNFKLLMVVALGLVCVHFATAEENLENLLQEMEDDVADDGEDELNTLEDEGDDDDDDLMSLLSNLDDGGQSDDLDKRRPRPGRCWICKFICKIRNRVCRRIKNPAIRRLCMTSCVACLRRCRRRSPPKKG